MDIDTLSDEQLGRFVRRVMARFGTAGDGVDRVCTASAALFLIRAVHSQKGASGRFDVSDVSIAGQEIGNWNISVQKEGAIPSAPQDSPHVLAGTLKPEYVQQAIDSFQTLSYIRVGTDLDTHLNS